MRLQLQHSRRQKTLQNVQQGPPQHRATFRCVSHRGFGLQLPLHQLARTLRESTRGYGEVE